MNNLFSFVKDTVFGGMRATVNLMHKRSFISDSVLVKEQDGNYDLSYKFKHKWAFVEKLNVNVKCKDDCAVFFIDTVIEEGINQAYGLTSEGAVAFKMNCGFKPDALISNNHESPFWTYPEFIGSFCEIPNQAQFVAFEKDGEHYAMVPLCGDNMRAEFYGPELCLSIGISGKFNLSGEFLAVAKANDPYTAVRNAYKYAREVGAIRIPLREERQLPDMFRGFGWCTWETCRHNVTSEKIYEKLDEYKEKGVPIKWIMIDDGWSCLDNWKLTSFEEDRTKFPEGLKACIAKIKADYGVEYVGVWHAYTAYWSGVDMTTALYEEQKDNLVVVHNGMAIPSPDEENAFKFWNTWHSYLKECGVDFLKIDNQSGYGPRVEGMFETIGAVRSSHRAIERSVMKNFDGGLINCMGMDMESVLSRPVTALSRNSDDFYPGRVRGFVQHLLQNAFNAVWHNNIYYCDYDMWQSYHESAVQSGVLRAISGSPIYISDFLGYTEEKYILPLLEDDGNVPLPELAAGPTTECYYRDPVATKNLLNVWNKSGDAFAVAMFNVLEEELTGDFVFDSIPDIDKSREYVAYEYFSKKYCRIKSGDAITETVKGDDVAVFSLYPIYTEDGVEYADIGDTSKYVPIASEHKTKTAISEIL